MDYGYEIETTLFGYARVSTKAQATDGNSLIAQEKLLRQNGAQEVYFDAYTGTEKERPQFSELIKKLKEGDTLIVTKFDRIARNMIQGIELCEDLIARGVKIYVLNIGILDNSPNGKLIRNIMLAFAEFERDMILERTREGKETAKRNPDWKDGRKNLYTDAQRRHAVEELKTKSYSQVSRELGIAKSTLARFKNEAKEGKI